MDTDTAKQRKKASWKSNGNLDRYL